MSGEKTEKPTQKKIDDARKKGQVAVSKDAQIVIKLLCFYVFFFWMSSSYAERFSNLLDKIVTQGFGTQHVMVHGLFDYSVEIFLLIVTPLVSVCAVSATLATWMQIGMLVAPESAAPSFKKLDAVSNLKNMFSKKSLVQLAISMVKVLVLIWVARWVFETHVSDMVYSYRASLGSMMRLLNDILQATVLYSLLIFVVISVLDWVMERANLMKQLRMSHSDIKDEYKQTQGNPEIKQKRKQEHRNLLNASLSKVPSAKVVVANPTHISVALDYEPGKHDLPFVLAMGVDADALLIRKKAKEHGIPIISNIKLARMIYQDCEEEEYIQKHHLELAAEVFKVVLEMKPASSADPV